MPVQGFVSLAPLRFCDVWEMRVANILIATHTIFLPHLVFTHTSDARCKATETCGWSLTSTLSNTSSTAMLMLSYDE
jgi:hypothetical protein